jgi:hypothetical protein
MNGQRQSDTLIHTHTHTHTHSHNGILFSHKEEQIMSFAGHKLETIMLSEIIEKDKDKYHMFSLICRI